CMARVIRAWTVRPRESGGGLHLEAAADDLGRVDLGAVAADLEMQVGTGRIAGRADQADAAALGDRVARSHVDAAQVGIEGVHAVRVAKLDEVAIAARIMADTDHAAFR